MVLCLFFYGFRLWSFFYFSMKSTIRNRRRVTYVISLRSENGSGRTFFLPKKKGPQKTDQYIFFFNNKKITNEFLPSPLIRNLVAFEKTIPVVPFRWKNRGTPDGVTTHQFGKPGHQLGNRFSERLFSLVAFLGSSSNDAPGWGHDPPLWETTASAGGNRFRRDSLVLLHSFSRPRTTPPSGVTTHHFGKPNLGSRPPSRGTPHSVALPWRVVFFFWFSFFFLFCTPTQWTLRGRASRRTCRRKSWSGSATNSTPTATSRRPSRPSRAACRRCRPRASSKCPRAPSTTRCGVRFVCVVLCWVLPGFT